MPAANAATPDGQSVNVPVTQRHAANALRNTHTSSNANKRTRQTHTTNASDAVACGHATPPPLFSTQLVVNATRRTKTRYTKRDDADRDATRTALTRANPTSDSIRVRRIMVRCKRSRESWGHRICGQLDERVTESVTNAKRAGAAWYPRLRCGRPRPTFFRLSAGRRPALGCRVTRSNGS